MLKIILLIVFCILAVASYVACKKAKDTPILSIIMAGVSVVLLIAIIFTGHLIKTDEENKGDVPVINETYEDDVDGSTLPSAENHVDWPTSPDAENQKGNEENFTEDEKNDDDSSDKSRDVNTEETKNNNQPRDNYQPLDNNDNKGVNKTKDNSEPIGSVSKNQ